MTATLPTTPVNVGDGKLDVVSSSDSRIENVTATLSGNTITITYDVKSNASTGSGGGTIVVRDKSSSPISVNVKYTNLTVNASTSSNIPSGAKIVGIALNGELTQTAGNTDWGELRPDDEIEFALRAGMFKWQDSSGRDLTVTSDWANTQVTTSQLSRGNITVRTSTSKGGNAIDDIEITGGNAAVVRISLVEYFVNTGEQDIDVSFYLAYKNSRNNNTKTSFTGTISNEQEEIYGDDDYASGEDGVVIKAEEYARNVEVFGGNGVYAIKNLFKGQKYYFVATQEIDSTDDAIMNQYPTIDTVIRIRSVNMSGSGNFVELRDYDNYYVYDADGNYIGTTSDSLPFSNRYYLSTERINITGTGSSSSTPDPSDGGDGNTGDGDGDGAGTGAGGGDNSNPGTGVNGFVNVAIVTGLIALVTAGAVSLKKKK